MTCAADAGSITWTDIGSSVYWVYKSTDGGASYNWIGRWKAIDSAPNPQVFVDANASVGDRYQVRAPNAPRPVCSIVSEPPAGNAFACSVTNNKVTWTNAGQSVYWIYRSLDNGATYSWIGRWKATDPAPNPLEFTDPNPVPGALYQISRPIFPRTNCTGGPLPMPTATPVPPVSPVVITVDNRDPSTSESGSWAVSSGTSPNGADSVWCNSGCSFTWSATLPTSGSYEVFTWYTAHPNRISNVPYQIEHAGGTATVTVDQTQQASQWVSLGTWSFGAGAADVTITSANGQANADAVQFRSN